MKNQVKKQEAIKALQSLINIGPVMANKLYSIGITSPSQLKKADPEHLFTKLKQKQGGHLDICVLYQLRGAIQNTPWWLCKNE